MTRRTPLLLLLALIAGAQGVVLIGYAVYDIVESVRVGITGPAEVSNLGALLGLIAITAAFGAALVWIAVGWVQSRAWARSPFVFAQLVIGFLGYELSQSSGSVERLVGQVAMVVAVIGIVMAFMPSVRRALAEDEAPH